MKLICDGLDLSDAVLKVGKALGTKTPNPVLEGIKICAKGDSLTFTATDLELTIEKSIKADVLMEGETVVTGKYFIDFVKKLENEQIELSQTDGGQLKIKYADSESEMQVFSVEDYPVINKDIDENSFEISQKDFKQTVERTVFACAQDDSRPILKGCLFDIENDVLTTVALDGFRMAVCKKEVKTSGNFKAIIPSRTLSEIVRLLEKEEDMLKVIIKKNSLLVKVGSSTLISRLIEGEFVKYNQIIPQEFVTNVKVNRQMLSDSIERASIVARSDRMNVVRLDVKENCLNVTAKSEVGNVNENIITNMTGKDVLTAFNGKYLIDFLRIIDEEFINIYLNSAIDPCIMRPFVGSEYLYLVLPVRISG